MSLSIREPGDSHNRNQPTKATGGNTSKTASYQILEVCQHPASALTFGDPLLKLPKDIANGESPSTNNGRAL